MNTTPRQVADAYVDALCDLDPITATALGTRPGDDRLPTYSPAGLEAEAQLVRDTLAELDRVLAALACAAGALRLTRHERTERPR